jgi:hypothetical protein
LSATLTICKLKLVLEGLSCILSGHSYFTIILLRVDRDGRGLWSPGLVSQTDSSGGLGRCHRLHVCYPFSFLDAFAKSRKATISVVMFVCLSAWNNTVPTGRIFMKFLMIFRECVQRIQVSLKSDKNNWYFTCRLTYIFITSRSGLLRMGNV